MNYVAGRAGRKSEHLVQMLEQDILSGKYRVGDKIPSIRELMDAYSLSKGTVERGIEILCRRGFLEKHVGSGTYITDWGGGDDRIAPGAVTVFCPRDNCFSDRPEVTSMFVQILIGIREAAAGKTELSSLCSLGTDPLRISPSQMNYANANSAGIILVGEYDSGGAALDLRVPAVGTFMIDNCDNRLSLINLDAGDAADKAARYFIERGRSHVVVVSNQQPIFVERAKIFAGKWQELGNSCEFRQVSPEMLLTAEENYFFASDTMAQNALEHTFRTTGRKIHETGCLCAVDGKRPFNPQYYRFPTYAVDWRTVGRYVFEELCGRIQNPGAPVRKILVSGRFITP